MGTTSNQAIGDYLETLELRHYSPETIVKYRQVLEQFSGYCTELGKEIDTATKSDVREFGKSLKSRGMKAVSINGYTDVLKTFFEHLKKKIRDDNPARKIPRHKEPKLLPSNVMENELVELLAKVENDTSLSVTEMAMFEVLLGTGMRVSEMCSLYIIDIEEWGRIPTPENIEKFKKKFPNKIEMPTWVPGIIRIRIAKGGRARIVPFSKYTQFVLKKYLQVREQMSFTSPYLFCNLSGGMMNRGNVYKIIKPFLDMTSSRKKGPHTLRHTYASHLLNRGADIGAVRDLLGHKSVSTTQLYTHLDRDAKKRIHQAAHPKG